MIADCRCHVSASAVTYSERIVRLYSVYSVEAVALFVFYYVILRVIGKDNYVIICAATDCDGVGFRPNVIITRAARDCNVIAVVFNVITARIAAD